MTHNWRIHSIEVNIKKCLFPTDGHIKSSRSTGQSIAIEAIPTSVFCGGTRDLEAVPSDGFQGFQAAAGEGDEKQEEQEMRQMVEMHFFNNLRLR